MSYRSFDRTSTIQRRHGEHRARLRHPQAGPLLRCHLRRPRPRHRWGAPLLTPRRHRSFRRRTARRTQRRFAEGHRGPASGPLRRRWRGRAGNVGHVGVGGFPTPGRGGSDARRCRPSPPCRCHRTDRRHGKATVEVGGATPVHDHPHHDRTSERREPERSGLSEPHPTETPERRGADGDELVWTIPSPSCLRLASDADHNAGGQFRGSSERAADLVFRWRREEDLNLRASGWSRPRSRRIRSRVGVAPRPSGAVPQSRRAYNLLTSGAIPTPEALPGLPERASDLVLRWWRGQDLNLRPSGYEPDELPDCSTPRRSGDHIVRPGDPRANPPFVGRGAAGFPGARCTDSVHMAPEKARRAARRLSRQPRWAPPGGRSPRRHSSGRSGRRTRRRRGRTAGC